MSEYTDNCDIILDFHLGLIVYKINFNNTKMIDLNSDDSDDEGFVSHQISID